MLNKNDITIWNGKDIIEKYKKSKILIPRYQRSFVWSEEKQKTFINSLKNGWPVGIVIIHEKDEKYYIMDGLQRTTTLAKYTSNWENHPEIKDKSFSEKITTNYQNEEGNAYLDDVLHSIRNNFGSILSSYKKRMKIDEEYFEKTSSSQRIENILDDVFFKKTDKVMFYVKKYLGYFDLELQESLKRIDKYKILAHIWKGDYKDAPTLFRRVNEQGEALSKLILIASRWTSEVSITWETSAFEKEFKKINEKRFASLLEVGIATKDQIEGQGKQKVFGALEIIYFIAYKIHENIESKDFKKFLIDNKSKNKDELNLESFVVLIKTYLKVKNNILNIKTENLDKEIENHLATESQIKEIIDDINFYINWVVERFEFIINHDKGSKFSETEKKIASKTMFWTYLFAMGIKDQQTSENKQIYSFLINKFSTKPFLVKTGDYFDKLDSKINNNDFFDDFNYFDFINEKNKFFNDDFFKKVKKKPLWERMFIIKILYLKFLYESHELKDLVLIPYFNDKDFAKGHTDEKNYNIFPNFGFFSKNNQNANIQNDRLLDKNQNLWLKENYKTEGKSLVDKIINAFEKFKEAKDMKHQIPMNLKLEEFLKNRMKLINKTIIYYLNKKDD